MKKRHKQNGARVRRTLLFFLLTLPGSAKAAREVHTYAVAKAGHAPYCEDDPTLSHPPHIDSAEAFASPFKALKSEGLWDEVNTFENTAVRGSYFTDSNKACSGCGQDMATNAGADTPDVLYLHTHGYHTDTGSYLLMGNSSYTCWAGTTEDMLFGSPSGKGDLEIAVVKACESGNYGPWLDGAYFDLVESSSRLSIWNAFHGVSSCGSHVVNYVGDYARISMHDGVGENWLDEAYADWDGPNQDDCPVSIVFGESESKRLHMFYYGGFRDREDTGEKTGSTIFFFKNCDPLNGVKLPG